MEIKRRNERALSCRQRLTGVLFVWRAPTGFECMQALNLIISQWDFATAAAAARSLDRLFMFQINMFGHSDGPLHLANCAQTTLAASWLFGARVVILVYALKLNQLRMGPTTTTTTTHSLTHSHTQMNERQNGPLTGSNTLKWGPSLAVNCFGCGATEAKCAKLTE